MSVSPLPSSDLEAKDLSSRSVQVFHWSGFIRGWLIADIVFCMLRATSITWLLGGLSKLDYELEIYGRIELASIIGMAFFGIIGNILLLLKKRAGIGFAWLNVCFTIVNICAAGFIEISNTGFPRGGPGAFGGVLGFILCSVLRVAVLVIYANVIMQAGTRLNEKIKEKSLQL